MNQDIARYDRQIRAWGFETQKCLEDTRFVFIEICAIGLECLKNLLLAGAKSIHLFLTKNQKVPDYYFSLNPSCQIVQVFEQISRFDFDFFVIFGDIPIIPFENRVILICKSNIAYVFCNIQVHIPEDNLEELTELQKTCFWRIDFSNCC